MRRTKILSIAAAAFAAALTSAVIAFAAPAGAQSAPAAAAPTPSPSSTRPIGDALCYVNWYVSYQYGNSFTAQVTFRNPTSATIAAPWTLAWSFANGQTVSSVSGGATFSQSGSRVTVTGPAGQTVPGGTSRSFSVVGT